MAGLLQYQGSTLPASVQRAAQNALDMQRISANKLPLAVEGSGIPDRTRVHAQNALEGRGRFAKAAETKGASKVPLAFEGSKLPEKVQKAARGLLDSRNVGSALTQTRNPILTGLGVALGGKEAFDLVSGEVDKYNALDDELRRADAVRANGGNPYDPSADATTGTSGILYGGYDNAMKASSDAAKYALPVSLLAPKKDAAPEEVPREQVAAQVESSAKKALDNNTLSRPKAAEAVVEANLAETGQEVTPEEKKELVKAETESMRSMDNQGLSKYLGLALAGVGLAATHFDKSGRAAQAFIGSFEKARDRGAARDKELREAEAAQAEFEYKKSQDAFANDIATQRLAQGDLRLELEKLATHGLLNHRDRVFEAGQRKHQDNLDLGYARIKAANDRAEKTAAAAKEKAVSGVAPSYKDSLEIVGSYFKGQGIDVEDGAAEAIAAQLPTLMKNNPYAPIADYIDAASQGIQAQPGEERMFWRDKKPSIKLKGLLD